MKTTIGVWLAAFAVALTLGLAPAYAASSHMAYGKTIEVTGCLQQGPVAKEYMIHDSNGQTWGVNETEYLYLNHYVGQKVTVTGDVMHPTMTERKDGGAHHYVDARDIVVDSEHCQ